MRAIIRKEIRENFVWALLMLLALAAALGYAVHADAGSGLSLVGNTMVMVSAVSFPIIGLALGLLQVLQVRRTGRWGFLIHRPLSRTRIVLAKVIGGLLLYTFSSAVPLAVIVAWVATPGHLPAPFDWHMILPRLADLIGGIVWYSTGLLVAARQARWIGSRLMPLGFTLLVSAFAWALPLTFWQALVMFIVATALILPAAWSNFTTRGVFERQPVYSGLLQVLSVGTGCALCIGAGTAILVSAIEWMLPPKPTSFQIYQITADGQIFRETYLDGKRIEETDLRGKPVSAPAEWPPMAFVRLDGMPSDQADWSEKRMVEGLQNSDSYVQPLGSDGRDRWFYVTPRRTIEGFDFSGHFIGSIGPGGFRSPSQPAEPFAEHLYPNENDRAGSAYGSTLLASRTTAYELNPGSHTLRVLFKTTGDPIIAPPAFLSDTSNKPPTIAMVVTQSRIHLLDVNTSSQVLELPLEHSSPEYAPLRVMRIKGDRFMVEYTSWRPSEGREVDWVVETDATGRILRRIELPVSRPKSPDPQWSEALQCAVLPTLPVLLARTFGNELRNLTLIICALVGLASAAFTFLLCRRYAFARSATIVWTIFNLLTGIPGILTLLSLRQLPARVRCPHCGKPRVVSREICEHCGAAFSPPGAEGIEILEMV